ncbi:MAG: hypothetical protein JOZ52_06810 [Acidobacteria bacterium]|nr:hypothetical protein [Acidobacteriota bacterium]
MTIAIRNSSSTQKNDNLKPTPARKSESNLDWLSRVRGKNGNKESLILIGGTSVSHFRVRCAQAQLRRDLMPSFWSLVGILQGDKTFVSVPLGLRENNAEVPLNNGVQVCSLSDYADPVRFPNIAVIEFTESYDSIDENIQRIKGQRSVVDLPSLMVPWLGYVWGAGQATNPLVVGQGVPSAVFAETVYGLAGIELTPGLSSSSSCPEAIWVSANWWHDFYDAATKTENQQQPTEGEALEKQARGGKASKKGGKGEPTIEETQSKPFVRAQAIIPRGAFAVRQKEAAIIG